MADTTNLREALNPCVFYLQKMEIELKCAICLNMLSQPLSLPCNHIFCSHCITRLIKSQGDCAVCKRRFSLQELHPAPHIEQMVSIYKGMDATFGAVLSCSNMWYKDPGAQATHDMGTTTFKEKPDTVLRYDPNIPTQADYQSARKSISKLRPVTKRVQVSPYIQSEMGAYDVEKKMPLINYEEKNTGFTRPSSEHIVTSIDAKMQDCKHADANMEILKLEENNHRSCGATLHLHHTVQLQDGQHVVDDGAGKEGLKRCVDNVGTDRLTKKQKVSEGSFDANVLDGQLALSDNTEEEISGSKGCTIASASILSVSTVQLHESSSINLNSTSSEIENTISCNQHLKSEVTGTETRTESVPSYGPFRSGVSSTGAIYSASHAVVCAFCLSSMDSEPTGPLLHYLEGKAVSPLQTNQPGVVHAHEKCIEWAPNAYYVEENVMNLEAEVARSSKIKCNKCGHKGAALGCYAKSCRRSFHVPCASHLPGCRWDAERYLLLCPVHSSLRFPGEKSKSKKKNRTQLESSSLLESDQQRGEWTDLSGTSDKWVLCGSGLTKSEKEIVTEFASLSGVEVSESWHSNVTHVIASVDDNGSCSRTLKVLMAILAGKWILNVDWLKACMEAKHPVSEEPYEIQRDIHGCCDGPRTGRMRAITKEPPLFNGLSFFFIRGFEGSYKGYLHDLVLAAGGRTLQTLPDDSVAGGVEGRSLIIMVYYVDRTHGSEGVSAMKQMIGEANSVAAKLGARVAGHEWLLDSVAACSLQLPDNASSLENK